MKNIIPPVIENLSPYVPGRRLEDVEAELGLSGIIKLGSNENSLGPSPKAMEALKGALGSLHRYSDADSRLLKEALAKKFSYNIDTIVAANGSSELILVLAHALLGPGLNAVMSQPSFGLYAKNAQAAGAELLQAPLTKDFGHDLAALRRLVNAETRLVFLDNPLNPTGAYLPPQELLDFHQSLPETTVLVVDEAYIDFCRQPRPDWTKSLREPGRLVILRTFSKIYGLAGLRAAYGLMDPRLASAINKVRQPFNLNSLAQVAAAAALDDDEFLARSREMCFRSLDHLRSRFEPLGLKCYPSEANFMMLDLAGRSADDFFQALLRQGLITRALSSFGLPGHLRVNAGLPSESEALAAAVERLCR